MKLTRTRLLVLAIIVLAGTVGWEGYVLASPAPSRNSTVTPGGQTTPCTYDVYKDGSTYVAKDCKTGDNFSQSTTFGTLWTAIIASNEAIFFEPAIYNTGGGVSIIGFTGITLWGSYNATEFQCTSASCTALNIGDPNANDALYHARAISIHDMTFDGDLGGGITNGAGLGVQDSYDVSVQHVIIEETGEIATGGFRIVDWNANQIQNNGIYVSNMLFLATKITIAAVINGYFEFSTFRGMPPNSTHRATVDFSKCDFNPCSVQQVTNFDFDHNTITGWTDCAGGFMLGFQAINNDTISFNYVDTCISMSTVAVATPACNALVLTSNIFAKGTGSVTFSYCNNVEITGNQWLTDTTPASGSTALTVDGVACVAPNCPVDFLIHHNQIIKWGGIGMDLNFSRGLVDSNDIYDVNQLAGAATNHAGLFLFKGLTQVHINDNVITSDVASGAGNFQPITIQTVSVNNNVTISQNYLYMRSCGGTTPNCGIAFVATPDSSMRIFDNYGENPFGIITNFNVGSFIGRCGTGTAVAASTPYFICVGPVEITTTGGTGVSISIQDFGGNNLQTGIHELNATYIPAGFKVNFGGFSVAPTVKVFGV